MPAPIGIYGVVSPAYSRNRVRRLYGLLIGLEDRLNWLSPAFRNRLLVYA